MKDPFQNRRMRLALQYLILELGIQVLVVVEASSGKWDVMNCNQVELSLEDDETILLDAKRPLDEEQCIAINDEDYGDYNDYVIEVELLSLESVEGKNFGGLGIIFNYLDRRNYDFIYLEVHDVVPTVTTFNTGYRLHGEYFYDDKIVIDKTIDDATFHSLKLVVDYDPDQSTKVFLDGTLVGTFQQHFVPRLIGGVFVTQKLGSVGLFRNFKIVNYNCDNGLDTEGNCVVADVFYKGFGNTETPTYADCSLIPSNAIYIKIVMGSFVDYFKPIAGKTYCDMLQDCKFHQWSSDGKNWEIPLYYGSGTLGGSAAWWPSDGRKYLPRWGGNGNNGGCCQNLISDGPAWQRAFNIFYGTV